MDKKKPVHRGGMLLKSEQRPDQDAGEDQVQAISVPFLLAFTRYLIRLSPSPDKMKLAMIQARSFVGASDEEVDALFVAVLGEMDQSPWPKDFF